MNSNLQDLKFIMELAFLVPLWVFVVLGIMGTSNVMQFPQASLASGYLLFPGR